MRLLATPARLVRWEPQALGTVLALSCVLACPRVGVAQEAVAATPVGPVFAALEGVWEGTGQLLDRTAEFRMEWRAGPGNFVRLSFSNAWVDEHGNKTPVLQSEAIYRANGSVAQGVWIDSRPQRIRLDAIVTDSSLVTTWTADDEQGRTEYVIRSSDEVVVRDMVEVDGELRMFGEARYRRAPPPGA